VADSVDGVGGATGTGLQDTGRLSSRERDVTSGKMKTRTALIAQRIAEYLTPLDRTDRKETPSAPRQVTRL